MGSLSWIVGDSVLSILCLPLFQLQFRNYILEVLCYFLFLRHHTVFPCSVSPVSRGTFSLITILVFGTSLFDNVISLLLFASRNYSVCIGSHVIRPFFFRRDQLYCLFCQRLTNNVLPEPRRMSSNFCFSTVRSKGKSINSCYSLRIEVTVYSGSSSLPVCFSEGDFPSLTLIVTVYVN